MPNRNFVVQYTIKATDKFSRNASRFRKAANKMAIASNKIAAAQKKANKEFDEFRGRIAKTGRSIRNFGVAATVGITLPVVLMGKSMIEAAADAEEARSKFKTIFSTISVEADTMAKNLVKSYGLSKIGAREMLSFTGDILTGFGFTQKAALNMSNQVQKLAVDMGSLKNVEPQRVSEAITKALLGERESLKLLGVAILESDVKRKVSILRSKGMRFESMKQARAMATFQLITEQAKNSIGDYNKTQDSATNRARKLTARFNDLQVTIGTKLLPVALKLINFFIGLINKFEALSPVTQNIILGFIGFAAIAGPLAAAIGLITLMFSALNVATLATAASMIAVAAPFIATAVAAMAVFTAVSMVVGKILELSGLTEKLESFGAGIFNFFNDDEIDLNKKIDLNQRSQTDVNLNVGLAGGLEQKGGANVSQKGRPANVGLNAAGA